MSSQSQPPVTDSPWFWLLLFSSFALLVIVVVGPRYSRRQGGIETRFQNRERALNWQGEQSDSPQEIDSTRLPRAPNDRPLQISLRPLMLGIASLFALALIGLSLFRLKRQRSRAGS